MFAISLLIFLDFLYPINGDNCTVQKSKCSACIILQSGNRTKFTEKENVFQAFVIAILLMYFFLGISVVCDKFMTAIEVMTSKMKDVKIGIRKGAIIVTKKRIWNETVANLTLMALGSSAPEILLAVIEICGKDFRSGDLGPGTIIGSAAFNLFVICGICILVIPKNESKRIEHLSVFLFTSFSSIFAYVWSYLVSVVISKGEIEVWEALMTLSLFPLTVIIAYFLDIRICTPNRLKNKYELVNKHDESGPNNYLVSYNEMENDEVRRIYIESLKDLKKTYKSCNLNILEDIARFRIHGQSVHSRAFYAMQSKSSMTGRAIKLKKKVSTLKSEVGARLSASFKVTYKQTIGFEHGTYIAKEDVGVLTIKVVRTGGNMNSHVGVWLQTINGTAVANLDFKPKHEKLNFKPFQSEIAVPIDIINDEIYEEDEYFTVKLFDIDFPNEEEDIFQYTLKEPPITTIIIIDDDHPGVFGFINPEVRVQENVGTALISVQRMHGARGVVNLPYHTEEGSAKGGGREYKDAEGVLTFKDDVFQSDIAIKIIDAEEYTKEKYFEVVLGKPYFDSKTKEYSNPNMLNPTLGSLHRVRVVIIETSDYKDIIDRLVNKPEIINEPEVTNWTDQFQEAFSIIPNDSNEDELEDGPPTVEYVVHYIILFWKVFFAFIPPTKYLGGWVTFIFSIVCIGCLTTIVGDLASLFGCYVGLLDEITSLTFVALGTSLPDTFASKVAAINEPSADSSIGNVTGSNAVNVYLGLGAAWAVASIVNKFRNERFDVNIASMDFGISFFFILAIIAVAILLMRRHPFIGGELGGKQPYKLLSGLALFGLYIIFVIGCSLNAYCIIHI